MFDCKKLYAPVTESISYEVEMEKMPDKTKHSLSQKLGLIHYLHIPSNAGSKLAAWLITLGSGNQSQPGNPLAIAGNYDSWWELGLNIAGWSK